MNQTMTLDQFLERLQTLPEDLKEAVLTSDFLDHLRSIQKNSSLHIDQGSSLEDAVFKVILGDINSNKFADYISSALRISQDDALKLSEAVDKEVLEPIRMSFREIEEENFDPNEETDSADVGTTADSSIELNSKDILAEIEKPQPSVPQVHETIVTTTQPVTKPAPIAVASTPTSTPTAVAPIAPTVNQPQVPVGWPVPQQTTATPQPVQAPSQTAANLNQKLEQATVTKPTEVKVGIDPYKEPIE